MAAPPAKMVREVIDEVIEYSRVYASWRELMHPAQYNARFYHEEFLLTVSISLLSSFCVRTFQLFDKDSRTKSLRTLITDIRQSHPRIAQKLESAISAQQPLLNKMIRLRHNVYAHRNKRLSPHDVFAAVKLTPKEMKLMVQLAQQVISEISDASGTGRESDIKQEFQSHEKRILDGARNALECLRGFDGEDDKPK